MKRGKSKTRAVHVFREDQGLINSKTPYSLSYDSFTYHLD